MGGPSAKTANGAAGRPGREKAPGLLSLHIGVWVAALFVLSASPLIWEQVWPQAARVPAVLAGPVVRVAEGDSVHVLLDGHVERVHYIGVEAPGRAHPLRREEAGAREAWAANRRLVEAKTVRLELDRDQRDRSGRLLAYVYVDDVMVNAELLRLGYGRTIAAGPNVRYRDAFVALERDAREARRGLWARP